MILPPTIRHSIIKSLELVPELESAQLRKVAADYRRAHVAPWLRRFAGVSLTGFECALSRLEDDGLITRRLVLSADGQGEWRYSLVRQWPARHESMSHTASRLMSGSGGASAIVLVRWSIVAALIIGLFGCSRYQHVVNKAEPVRAPAGAAVER